MVGGRRWTIHHYEVAVVVLVLVRTAETGTRRALDRLRGGNCTLLVTLPRVVRLLIGDTVLDRRERLLRHLKGRRLIRLQFLGSRQEGSIRSIESSIERRHRLWVVNGNAIAGMCEIGTAKGGRRLMWVMMGQVIVVE